MKAKLFLFSMIAMLISSCNTNSKSKTVTDNANKDNKILVVYYSYSGNTRAMATMIKDFTGADIFEIVPSTPYPNEYQAVEDRAKKEIANNFRPDLKTKLPNINEYNVIFVGSPNWWSTIAPPVATFLSSYDFAGKTVIPFMTHGGGGMAHSEEDIKALCPNATMLKGMPVLGTDVKDAKPDVAKWLRDMQLME